MAVLHADAQQFALLCGGQMQLGKNVGFLTDSQVAASSTIATLEALVSAGPTPPAAADYSEYFPDINQGITYGNNIAAVPNNPSSVSTAAALIAGTGLNVQLRPAGGPWILE